MHSTSGSFEKPEFFFFFIIMWNTIIKYRILGTWSRESNSLRNRSQIQKILYQVNQKPRWVNSAKNGVIFRSFTYPRMIERNTKCKSNALQVKMRREDVTAEWTMCSCTMLIERITCVRWHSTWPFVFSSSWTHAGTQSWLKGLRTGLKGVW